MEIEVKHLSALPNVAQQLLDFAGEEKVFIFEGDMGAGKTTFIKAFCKVLGILETVSSPTYSIVNEYEGSAGAVFHFDFYRIKDIQEAYDLGFEEYLYGGAICLIEWPQKIAELLPESLIKIDIIIVSETERVFKFSRA